MVIKIAWDGRILGLNIKENNPLLCSQVNDSKSATPIKIYKVVKKTLRNAHNLKVFAIFMLSIKRRLTVDHFLSLHIANFG
jgi:hypothetical protein